MVFIMNNEKFNEIKAKHPEWSDEQIWTAISLDMQTDTVIEKKGSDVNADDPDVITEILRGARTWLQEVLPDIFAKVAKFFDTLLTTIGEWVQKGLSYVVDAIAYLLNRK